MRVAPVALFCRAHDLDDTTCAALAQFQAALTHGHATGLAAADLTAFAVRRLAEGCDPGTLPDRLRTYAVAQRATYHREWLGPVWQRPVFATPEAFIAHGWDECLTMLDRLDDAIRQMDRATDPCIQTGQGWIAEEAFATGLLCFLLFPDVPVAALRRAALTNGDSDSIACITGALAGAYHGLAAWPDDWVQRIEYRDRLMTLGNAWDN